MAVASIMLVLWYEETLLNSAMVRRGENLSYYMSVISNWLFTKIFKSLSGLSIVKGNFN